MAAEAEARKRAAAALFASADEEATEVLASVAPEMELAGMATAEAGTHVPASTGTGAEAAMLPAPVVEAAAVRRRNSTLLLSAPPSSADSVAARRSFPEDVFNSVR